MNRLKLLVVDDEPGIRSGIIRILRNFNCSFPFMEEDFTFEFLEAESGEKALELLKPGNIDLVLLDNKLPGIEGIEVLRHINEEQYDCAVMIITSYASLDLAIKATNMGAYNFMPKPFTPAELKISIESITKHLYLKRMTGSMRDEAKQIRFQFLSVLSHELKSPINAVEGYLKIIKEKQAGDRLDDYLGMIDRSMERIQGMRNLIMDLLDMTRIRSGKKVRNLQSTDLSELIKVAVLSVEPLAIQRNISIDTEMDESCLFYSDPSEMEIILNNLISNAVKYNRDNGEVYIKLQKKAAAWELKVSDTGIGMSEKEQQQLFGDFVRIKNEKTKFITGSGLGLSICKKMIEIYHGTIRVESTPDVGSTFTVTLPIEN